MDRMVARTLSEGEATLQVLLAAGGLAVLGLVLLVLTVRWWRTTRPAPEALSSLELLSDRRFRSATAEERLRMLGEHRSRPPVVEPSPDADATAAAPAPDDVDHAER